MALDEAGWRRAIGIPDVIGDKIALELLTDNTVFSATSEADDSIHSPIIGQEEDQRIASAVLDSLIALAVAGDLDGYLVARRSHALDGAAERVLEGARIATGMNVLPKALAEPLLERVKAYVTDRPFEDPNWPINHA